MSSRPRILVICSALVVALLAVAAFAPLPYSIVLPGDTADTLGAQENGRQVITVDGVPTRRTSGSLLLTTIMATNPDATVKLTDVVDAWLDDEKAAMPRTTVYPEGDSVKEVSEHTREQMRTSQQDATRAALRHLKLSPQRVRVKLELADVGGPSAGLMFSLGIIDKIDGDGRGGDLTGGKVIAGTGTITSLGKVGPVGGVPLKELAARRDGATVFLVPEEECGEAKENVPDGLRLVPVRELDDAVASLKALSRGGDVPSC